MKLQKSILLALLILVTAGCAEFQGIGDKILGDRKGAICNGFQAVMDVDVSKIASEEDRAKAVRGQKAAADFYNLLRCEPAPVPTPPAPGPAS
jgi:hypothetical protein